MNKKNIFRLMFFTMLIFAFSFVKISFFPGSYKFFFSGINLVFPVLGSLFSSGISGLFVLLFFLFKKFTLGGAITLGLPTLVATVAFSVMTKQKEQNSSKIKIYNFVLRVVLPILAIILFVANPIGKEAFIYSFYWLIPVVLYFFEKVKQNNSIFLKSLTVTFIAHAVGSLMWLYFMPTTSVYWVSLIPVVFIERLIFSIGISFLYLFIRKFLYKFICIKNKNGIRNDVC